MYRYVEYPKHVGDVVVQNAAEEIALRAAHDGARLTGIVQAAALSPENMAARTQTEAPLARLGATLALRPSPLAPAEKPARLPSAAAIRMRRSRQRR